MARERQVVAFRSAPASLQCLPAAGEKLVLEPGLAYEVDQVIRDGRVRADSLPSTMVAAAAVALAVAERLRKPASLATITAWMEAVGGGVNNCPAEHAFDLRVAMVADTSGDLPWICWTQETRREFARRGDAAKWFPSDGEVDGFLRPLARKLLSQARALRSMVEHGQMVASRDRARLESPEPMMSALSVAARDAAFARLRGAVGGGLRPSQVAVTVAVLQGVASPVMARPLVGEALWRMRNNRLRAAGFPELARPDTFEGYGMGGP